MKESSSSNTVPPNNVHVLHPPSGGTPFEVVIIGGGVIGLTSAVTLARLGYRVRVISNQSLEDTTSYQSAAFWLPVLSGADPRVIELAKTSLRVFASLAEDPSTGVRPARLRVCYTKIRDGDLSWRAAVPTTPVSTDELPEGCICGFDAQVYRMQMEKYLAYLRREAEILGVKFDKSFVTDLEAVDGKLIINCTGIWAKHLVGDAELKPIRGQVALVTIPPKLIAPWNGFDILIIEGPAPDGNERLDYIVRRDDDILTGGTSDIDDWQLTPRDDQRATILANCRKIMPALNDASFISDRVGLRPYRRMLRLDVETSEDGKIIVHAYGHGGSGVTLSWGTADWIQTMVCDILIENEPLWLTGSAHRKAA